MEQCRNCGSEDLRELGFIGILAPFFLKRVFHAEIRTRISTNSRKRQLQSWTESLRRVFSRIHPPGVAVELQSCHSCGFIQTKYPFAEDGISRLYSDYRSDTYNRERSYYEPEYANIKDAVGSHTESGMERVPALTAWIKSKIEIVDRSMLDFGGADGKFLPDLPGRRFVYEVSDVSPAPGVTRISSESSLETYDYVQLSHVLEHVVQPLALTRHVSSLVKPGGYLLVEVPQDLPPDELTSVQNGTAGKTLTIHEHINYYSVSALRRLLEQVGLEIIAVDAVPVVSPLARQFFIRGIARKTVQAS